MSCLIPPVIAVAGVLKKKNNMEIRIKICEIQYLAILCQKVIIHCFTRFSPHVNRFSIDIYDGEWSKDGEYIQTDFSVEDTKQSIEKADCVIQQLKSILKKGKIDYAELTIRSNNN